MMTKATLRSNSGACKLTLTFKESYGHGDDCGIETDVALKDTYYDGDHEWPISFNAESVQLSRAALKKLRTALQAWVALPMDELQAQALDGHYSLTLLSGKEVSLVFEDREDTIADEKPVVTIRLRCGTMQVENHFVTDQSCLRLFVEELAKAFD